ncbi:hypothetical protein [Candidatus Amarolinea dominans]|nr:hypothetical protein [Anaerolineae bacterium]
MVFDADASLYVGGSFDNAGGTAAGHVARWDGISWHPLGAGTDGSVLALSMGQDGLLYAGGYFTIAGGMVVNRIASWDGTSWYPLGTGVYGFVNALAAGIDGSVYAAGNFLYAGGVLAHLVARWDGGAWHALGTGLGESPYPSYVSELAINTAGELWAAGSFGTAGGKPSTYVAVWSPTAMSWFLPVIRRRVDH